MPAFARLMRLHQPTGIWLLLWPCWWALALASHGEPEGRLLALFALGAIVMRGAGCIINDLIDREFDGKVERTRLRPLASGEITPRSAVLLLFLLLCVALFVALHMRPIVLLLAACALPLVAVYPFMKRITWWPQAFLGLTFNWGAWMGFAAVTGTIGLAAFALYAGCFFWTLGYDTIYAHQDVKDDEKIGVKSTARRLGNKSKYWIAGFYTLAIAGWAIAGWLSSVKPVFYIGLVVVAGNFSWQVISLKPEKPENCGALFRSNTTIGWVVFAGSGVINGVIHSFLTQW